MDVKEPPCHQNPHLTYVDVNTSVTFKPSEALATSMCIFVILAFPCSPITLLSKGCYQTCDMDFDLYWSDWPSSQQIPSRIRHTCYYTNGILYPGFDRSAIYHCLLCVENFILCHMLLISSFVFYACLIPGVRSYFHKLIRLPSEINCLYNFGKLRPRCN